MTTYATGCSENVLLRFLCRMMDIARKRYSHPMEKIVADFWNAVNNSDKISAKVLFSESI